MKERAARVTLIVAVAHSEARRYPNSGAAICSAHPP